jgi:lipoprotein-anchoring transpeptidase ErfK/SrfK
MARTRLLTLILAAMLAACMAPGAAIAAPVPTETTIIRVVAPTVATARPDGGKTVAKLKPVSTWGGPTQLRVKSIRTLPDETKVYEAYLPKRPNGATGWVRSSRVATSTTPWAIVIDLSERNVRVFNAGVLKRTRKVVIGTDATPTPTGEFFVADRVERRNPNEFTGPWILTFAYSDVLEQFDGGDGRIAMHGRGGASLNTPLGTAASHGCVRLANKDISWIAERVPEGTPVRVRR